nr:MAG TPA: hypothetical protein [Caudoviricetes sp.]
MSRHKMENAFVKLHKHFGKIFQGLNWKDLENFFTLAL